MTLPGLSSLATVTTASIVDAARLEGLPARFQSMGVEARSLYQGKSEIELADVAPYLVDTPAGSDASRLVFGEWWGQSVGVHLVTEAPLTELRAHLRHFLMVVTEDGKTLYFRFYDPRVLRTFLPTCGPEQLAEFFGPVSAFLVEDEDPAKAIRFTLDGGALKVEVIDLGVDALKKPALKIEWKGRR